VRARGAAAGGAVIEFYPQIKALHVVTVLISGGLFLLRGLLVQGGRATMAMAPPLRWLAVAIDSVLLTAALMLVTMLPSALFANHWLGWKLALLLLYIGLGSLALRRGRAGYLAGAVAAYVLMLGIARAHHPLGWFVPLLHA
jgi:uncharacterized membrane protein SirB2